MPLSEADREIVENGSQAQAALSEERWARGIAVLERLWEERRALGRWVALGLVLSILATFRVCKYDADVALMSPDGGSSSGLAAMVLPMLSRSSQGFASLPSDSLLKTTSAVFVKVLESRSVQDRLIERFDLRQHYGVRYWEDARKRLEKRTDITEDKKTGIIDIVVRDENAGFATALAGAYVEELDHTISRVSTSAARRERMFIEQRLAEEKALLEESEKQLSQFQSSSMAVDVPQQTRVMVEAGARLQGELIAKRAELEGLKQIYAPESPRVRSVQGEVASLEKALAKMNVGPATPEGATPATAYPSVKSLPALGVRWADLYRNTKIQETVYELLNQQYEVARIQEAKEIPTVKVLDPPVLPEKRYPRPWMVIAAGTLGAFFLACLGSILRNRWEAWDGSDPRRLLLLRIARGLGPVRQRVQPWRTNS